MNFARDVVDAAPPGRARDGVRRPERRAARVVHGRGRRRVGPRGRRARRARRRARRRGDDAVGNRPEWVLTMVACFRLGAVVLPCTEQLRAGDLRHRLAVAAAAAGRVRRAQRGRARRRRARLRRAARAGSRADGRASPCRPPSSRRTTRASSRSPRARRGAPKAVLHGQRYLRGQALQAEHWLDAAPGRARVVHGGDRLVEVGAQRVHRAVAARRRGAAPRRALRSRRAARAARARARRRPVHGAHGVPRHRRARDAARHAVAARPRRRRRGAGPGGAAGLARGRPGCGSATATARRRRASSPACRSARPPAPGSMGRALPGVALDVDATASWSLDPATDPTFFLGYLGEPPPRGTVAHRRPRRASTRTASSSSRAAATT